MNKKAVRYSSWNTKAGTQRKIRLRAAWDNMRGRCNGNQGEGWKGLSISFENFYQFRAWAITHGYSKQRCSLDRLDVSKGYSPENCEWVTRSTNSYRAGVQRVGMKYQNSKFQKLAEQI